MPVTDYDTAHQFLHTKGNPVTRKKIGNNTYVHRISPSTIGYRLHNTDVVTYHLDGRIVLDTGGWLTVTTKDRINAALPHPWYVSSIKGTWYLTQFRSYGDPDTTPQWRYTDGISLHMRNGDPHHLSGWFPIPSTCLPDDKQDADDRHNATMKKLIGKYIKGYSNEKSKYDTCNLCLGTYVATTIPTQDHFICYGYVATTIPTQDHFICYGDRMQDTQHLIDHMLDGIYPTEMVIAAITQANYGDAALGHQTIVKRQLRAYLGARLFRGATTGVHGRKPVTV